MNYLKFALFFFPVLVSGQSSFEKGEISFKKEQYELAKTQFESTLKDAPGDLKSIEYLGDIECHLKHWEKAIPYYKKLQKLKPTEAEYCYKYGGALAMHAKDSNAVTALLSINDIKAAFEKTILLNPNHIGARWALLEIYIQLPSIVGGSQKKANSYSDELLKISPVDGYLSKGHIEEYFKQYSKAEAQYIKAIAVGNSFTTYQKLADLYKNKMDRPEKAKQILASYHEKNKL